MGEALELADGALAIARHGSVLALAMGDPASRHFTQLLRGECAPRALELAALELRTQLRAAAVAADTPLWCVTPAHAEPAALGAVLSLARGAGARIGAFVDGATLSVATLALEHDALVVEMGPHHLAVTAVAAGSVARRRRSVVSLQGGWVALSHAWLDLIRAAMVNRTRLDPLRDAVEERRLLAALPAIAREAAERGVSTVAVRTGTRSTDIELTRDQLVAAAQPVLRELARLAGQLHVPGVAADVLMTQACAALPGFDALLERLARGARQLLLAAGHAAAAASLLPPPHSGANSDTVPYVRRVAALSLGPLAALVTERAAASAAVARSASHLVWQGRAVALAAAPLVVGRGANPELAIALPEDCAGISRRHCTFVATGAEVALIDHSSFGTFLNGERVVERAAIRAGDRVRIGEPGVEFEFVAVDPT